MSKPGWQKGVIMKKKIICALMAVALSGGIFSLGGGQTASAAGGVVFYKDIYCNGSHTSGIGPGYYSLNDLKSYGFINDWASSVTIPDGWSVTLYANDNFGGTSWTLDQNDFNSKDFRNFGGNDVVSSVVIRK